MTPINLSPSMVFNLFAEMVVLSGISILVLLGLRLAKVGSASLRAKVALVLFALPLLLIASYGIFFNRSWFADCSLVSICQSALLLPATLFGSFWQDSLLRIVVAVGILLTLIVTARQILTFVLEHRFIRKFEQLEGQDGQSAFQIFKRLAVKAGVSHAQLKVCRIDQSLAGATGVFRPKVLVSSWLVAKLDLDELEAVLAHEIAHIKRRDNFINRFAMVIKDFLFFLPSTHLSWMYFTGEREKACDDLAISLTGHPLSLASALTKVCRFGDQGGLLDRIISPVSQGFIKRNPVLEERIKRLIYDASATDGIKSSGYFFSVAVGFLILGTLFAPILSLPGFGKTQSSGSCCTSAKSSVCVRTDCSH